MRDLPPCYWAISMTPCCSHNWPCMLSPGRTRQSLWLRAVISDALCPLLTGGLIFLLVQSRRLSERQKKSPQSKSSDAKDVACHQLHSNKGFMWISKGSRSALWLIPLIWNATNKLSCFSIRPKMLLAPTAQESHGWRQKAGGGRTYRCQAWSPLHRPRWLPCLAERSFQPWSQPGRVTNKSAVRIKSLN